MNKGCSCILILYTGLLLCIALVYFLDDKKAPVDSDGVVIEDIIEDDTKPVQNIQYVDIRGKHGEVTVHTYMSKDSVKILVGKPTRVSLMTIGNDAHEDWIYEFSGEGRYGSTRELNISFVNGKLRDICEY